ncbi:alpha/beta fold hydrolase [Streptomyces sp. NPDC005931]|uniref:alpha/beta fold hydrolase n=1 Tax=Streptomyces sp. NPDC005931 TaxID=3364737 RepID=UPI00367B6E41
MARFVTAAGTWLGAWAWDEVAVALRGAGHEAYPLTLAGLAERRGMPAGQRTHVADAVEAVERSGLRDVVLVGHSHAGIPVGQAAERIGGRLPRVVCVDADVPVDGRVVPVRPAVRPRAAGDRGARGFWPPRCAEDYAGQGPAEEAIARIVVGATPHPGATLTEPAVLGRQLGELPATCVTCLLDGEKPPAAAGSR